MATDRVKADCSQVTDMRQKRLPIVQPFQMSPLQHDRFLPRRVQNLDHLRSNAVAASLSSITTDGPA
jgi:hypothetical protein